MSDEFWRQELPELDINGKIVKGGMFPHQKEWWDLDNFIKALITGYGGGKTFSGAKRSISLALENAPAPGMIVSPSYKMAKKTVIPTFNDLLTGKERLLHGFTWKFNKSDNEYLISYKGRDALIWVASGDDPESLKGPNLAFAWIDEPFIQKREVFEQMMARIRDPRATKKELLLTGCVTKNTAIITDCRSAKIGSFLKNTKPKEYSDINIPIYGIDKSVHTATKFFNNGKSKTVSISTQSGFNLEGTLCHPILVMSKSGVPKWVKLDNIKVGDFVAIDYGMNTWGGYLGSRNDAKKLDKSVASGRLFKTAKQARKAQLILLNLGTVSFISPHTDGFVLKSRPDLGRIHYIPNQEKLMRSCYNKYDMHAAWFPACSTTYNSIEKFIQKNEDYCGAGLDGIIDLKRNLKNNYYWDPVKSIESGYSETVDFVVPDTHSFWSNGFISHNTPESVANWGYDICIGDDREKVDIGIVQASSKENKALGEAFTERLETMYTELAASAYVGGQFVNMVQGLVYYGFNRERSVASMVHPRDHYDLYAGMDFNVNPMSACIFWVHGSHMHFIDEFEMPNADTQAMCAKLRTIYGQQIRGIYPDATGVKRQSNAPKGASDFSYIKDAGFTVHANSRNPLRKDRYNAVNGKFAPTIGMPTLTIDPKCKQLIKYLTTYSHEEVGKASGEAMSHLLDAFSYPIAYLFPIIKGTVQVKPLIGG